MSATSIKVRLLQPLRHDGIIWAKGLVIAMSADKAKQLVRLGVAEHPPPERPALDPPVKR